MGMLTTQNVEEYKQKYNEELKAKSIELGTDITDEMITDGVIVTGKHSHKLLLKNFIRT